MHKIQNYSSARTSYFALSALLLLSLQACGSSDTDSSEVSMDAPFADPVDATSLQDALVTGAFSTDTAVSWDCVLADSNGQLSYRLIADGTGIEIDRTNSNSLSSFTWQATSATTITTTLASTGMVNTFTDIRFADQNAMSLLIADSLQMTCERKNNETTVPVTITGNNQLSYGGEVYALTHGFEESFSFRPDQRGDTHTASDFDVADADFVPVNIISIGPSPTITIWRPNNASIWLRATLRFPGGERFTSATFSYESNSVDEKGPAVAGKAFFNEGVVGIDLNKDGTIESDDGEFIDITAGTISVERLNENNARMGFDVTLANGENVSGEFQGLFVLFEN